MRKLLAADGAQRADWLRNGQPTRRRERLRRNRRDDAAGGGVLPPVLAALARRHEQHGYALGRIVSMPASLGYDHEVAGPKVAQRLALQFAQGQTCRASENVEQLVAGRVQLPRRTALEAGGGAVAPVELERLYRACRLFAYMREIHGRPGGHRSRAQVPHNGHSRTPV